MNMAQCNQHRNYYTTISGVEVYVDCTNERLKILDYKDIPDEESIEDIILFAKSEGLGKIIFNCKTLILKTFIDFGFSVEGSIEGFYRGEDAYCVSYSLDPGRKVNAKREEEDSILYKCVNDISRFTVPSKQSYKVRRACKNDIPQMVKLFSAVFETYPSPVFSKEYLEKAMSMHVLYKVAEEDGKIISIASAEADKINLNAEITDCATYPEHRGRGILQNLIYELENELKEKGFFTAYSLSRAINPGINKALCKMGYKYSGRLTNNCHICGGYEDMNIWVKRLKDKKY